MKKRIAVRTVLILGFLFANHVLDGGPFDTMLKVGPFGGQVRAQQTFQAQSYIHRIGGDFYSAGYNTWSASIITGNSATGSQTITLLPSGGAQTGGVVLADGSNIPLANIFTTNTPILVNDANSETVTPSAVSFSTCPAGALGVGQVSTCVLVTATFSNTHGPSGANPVVVSGDQGIAEAWTDAAANGGGLLHWIADTGIVTLNTGSVTTTTTTKVPAVYISMAGSGRVTTTVTTSTSWAVGTATNTTDFCTAQTTLTAGTTCNVVAATSPTARGTGGIALTAIVYTMGTGAPGAGAIKARVYGLTNVQASQ